MPVAPIKSTYEYGQLQFYNDVKNIDLTHGLITTRMHDSFENIEMINDDIKIVIRVAQGASFYHFIYDFLGTVVTCPKKRNQTFIFLMIFNDQLFNFNFIKKICDKHDIKFIFINKTNANLKINNFYYTSYLNPIACAKTPTSENIYNAVVGFVEKKPTKKVYISRKYMESSYPDIELTEASTRNTDRHKRIDNEEEIENFFKSYNFEILYPENSFDSLEQQIDYFKDVKTLVGLTGAGLTNSVFMQPETNLVEIASPIIFYNRIYSTSIVDFSEAQHFFYSKIAFERKLFYYTVNNIEKKSNIVIERIKHNKGILDLLNE